ncbi:MAG: LacI family DNA-binding transcriptional regulator [Ignavibacteriales bacterium]|nr:LacI family transcriptional regulator [Ignavibacteriaceae bacterium]QOJ28821.1 MAG: LacI family DNA-binding transcriptional regulator [Ignavibacteriales bacterium]
MTRKIQPVKLEDIAKRLGVSKVTVSKALRNHPDISVEMRRKVRELADQLGYIPNFLAKNLSSRRSNIVGLVVPKIAHFFFGSIIESIYNEAFKQNYEILLTVSREMASQEKKHILSLLSMKVDGLIVSVTQETQDVEIFEMVKRLNVPLVFIDRVPKPDCAPSVTVDDYGGAYTATEYYIKKGYTKIAHIGGYTHVNIGKNRMNGYLAAMNDHKIPLNSSWIIEGGFSEEDGYAGFKSILAKGQLPQAVIAVTYPVALGIYQAAQEAGVTIPGDIKVTCFGNLEYKNKVPSVFNFVHQPAKELGEEALRMMLRLIENREQKVPSVELKTELVITNDNEKSVA